MSKESFNKKRIELEKNLSPVRFLPADFGLFIISVFGVGFWSAFLLHVDWSEWFFGLLYLLLFILSFYGMLNVYARNKNVRKKE